MAGQRRRQIDLILCISNLFIFKDWKNDSRRFFVDNTFVFTYKWDLGRSIAYILIVAVENTIQGWHTHPKHKNMRFMFTKYLSSVEKVSMWSLFKGRVWWAPNKYLLRLSYHLSKHFSNLLYQLFCTLYTLNQCLLYNMIVLLLNPIVMNFVWYVSSQYDD